MAMLALKDGGKGGGGSGEGVRTGPTLTVTPFRMRTPPNLDFFLMVLLVAGMPFDASFSCFFSALSCFFAVASRSPAERSSHQVLS